VNGCQDNATDEIMRGLENNQSTKDSMDSLQDTAWNTHALQSTDERAGEQI